MAMLPPSNAGAVVIIVIAVAVTVVVALAAAVYRLCTLQQDWGKEEKQTLLREAVEEGDFTKVQSLLDSGANVDAAATYDMTALQYAASNGQAEVAKLLIDRDAELDKRSTGGWTALHHAAYNGHLEVVKLLVEGGADLTIKSNSGKTARDILKGGSAAAMEWRRYFGKQAVAEYLEEVVKESVVLLGLEVQADGSGRVANLGGDEVARVGKELMDLAEGAQKQAQIRAQVKEQSGLMRFTVVECAANSEPEEQQLANRGLLEEEHLEDIGVGIV